MPNSNIRSKPVRSTVAQTIGSSGADVVPTNVPVLTEQISSAEADGSITTAVQEENENRAPKRARNSPQRERIPFRERVGCCVADAVEASGRSRSRLYEEMKAGKLAFWKDGKHRIVSVQSLLALND
jgi:hypothetical protein